MSFFCLYFIPIRASSLQSFLRHLKGLELALEKGRVANETAARETDIHRSIQQQLSQISSVGPDMIRVRSRAMCDGNIFAEIRAGRSAPC